MPAEPASGGAVVTGPALLTVAQSAVVLNVCQRTVLRKVHEGDFPAVQIGSRLLLPLAWINALLADAIKGGLIRAEQHGRSWTAANGSTS